MGDFTQLLGAFNVPFVMTYHADIIKQKMFLPFYRPVLNLLFKKARKIIFSAKENIAGSMAEGHLDKCVVIPFGVELEAFQLRDAEALELDVFRREMGGPTALFVGAARYYKGLDVLLKSMVQVKGRLIVAGRGTQSDSLDRMAGDLGVRDKVLFCGEVTPSRLRILLNAAHVFVLL
jgi:rhamnosyl/mannosyltransferase